MNENVGASFGLSVMMVVFFAVVLYQPETPTPPSASIPPPTPSAEPVEAHPPDAPVVLVEPPVDRIVAVSRPVAPVTPRGAFTTVREHETLDDVARRVYGDDDAVTTLWAANRDLLDRPDAAVTVGSILRTP